MHRCARCDGRLGRGVSFCPTCGVPVDAAAPLDVELGDERGGRLEAASEVHVVRSSGVRRRWLGAGVTTALVIAVVASLASGGDRRAAPPPTGAGADEVSQPTGAPGAGASGLTGTGRCWARPRGWRSWSPR